MTQKQSKQFYTEFLRQAEGYVRRNPCFSWGICIDSDSRSSLERFGKVVSEKIGHQIGAKLFMLSNRQRKEVMTELIKHLKEKIKEC